MAKIGEALQEDGRGRDSWENCESPGSPRTFC